MSTPISKKILTRLLVRSYRFIKHMNSEYLRERGYDQIKIGHVMVMMNLNESEPATVSDLVKKLEMSKQAVSVLVKELIDKNFIISTKHPNDSRAFLISKTTEGENFLSVLEESRQKLNFEVSEILGKDKFEDLLLILTELVNHFENKVGKLNDKIGNTKL